MWHIRYISVVNISNETCLKSVLNFLIFFFSHPCEILNFIIQRWRPTKRLVCLFDLTQIRHCLSCILVSNNLKNSQFWLKLFLIVCQNVTLSLNISRSIVRCSYLVQQIGHKMKILQTLKQASFLTWFGLLQLHILSVVWTFKSSVWNWNKERPAYFKHFKNHLKAIARLEYGDRQFQSFIVLHEDTL